MAQMYKNDNRCECDRRGENGPFKDPRQKINGQYDEIKKTPVKCGCLKKGEELKNEQTYGFKSQTENDVNEHNEGL